ncbi:MAG: DUF2961 domain-containing protein [Candidatus Lokiarchaeota archaeon]|nr:DUF2961 domain-containing protein [Candidatus Lokiarchaeota archaeon]
MKTDPKLFRTDTGSLPILEKHNVKQVSTHHHAGKKNHKDWVEIPPKESYKFPKIQGPGVINCIWFTISPYKNWFVWNIYKFLKYSQMDSLRRVLIRIYYDDEEEPSVEVPLGDFFGVGFGRYVHYHSKYLGMTSGGFFSYIPMPFRESCQVEIVNTHRKRAIQSFYGAITYEKLESFPDNFGYFQTQYREEIPCKKGVPYTILEKDGKGHFMGTTLSMHGYSKGIIRGMLFGMFYLEGNLKIFKDDDPNDTPSYECTGTEDYFLSGWYFNKNKFYAPLHGITVRTTRWDALFGRSRTSCYRFHEPPISFDEKIKVLIHHGEFDQVKADYYSVAYYYIER